MRDNIKIWWSQLADRERQLLSVGGVAAGIFVLYSAIWSPLSTAVSDNKQHAQSQQAVLATMQPALKKIQALQAEGVQATATAASRNLLALMEQTVTQHQLSHFLKQIQPAENNQVQLTFDQVPFDELMGCLQQLSATQGVRIVSLKAERLSVVGTANVTLMVAL